MWDASGKVLWKRHYPGGLVPWKGRELHLTGSGIQMVDPRTGEVGDRFDLEGDWTSLITRAVVDNVLLLGPKTSLDPMRALDIERRRILWERSVLPEIRTHFGIECAYLGLGPSGPGRFVGTSGDHVVGFSLGDGSPRWVRSLGLDYSMAPVRDGRIYAWSTPGASTTLTMLDITTGTTTRETTVPRARNQFVVIDEATGDIVMDRELAAEGAPFDRFQEPGRPTFCRRHMVYATRSNWIVIFRLSDGAVVWRQQYRDQVFTPAFDDNRLYFPCADGTLVVFEAEGEEL